MSVAGLNARKSARAGKAKTGSLKGEEVAVVDQVAIVGTSSPELQRANVLMRLNRNPVVGDKFSSRHGQKGVLSQLWPDVDMPFAAATGMRCAPLNLGFRVRASLRAHDKGVLSQLWPDVDMPFAAATGMRCAHLHLGFRVETRARAAPVSSLLQTHCLI